MNNSQVKLSFLEIMGRGIRLEVGTLTLTPVRPGLPGGPSFPFNPVSPLSPLLPS